MKTTTFLFAALCAVMSLNAVVYKVSPTGAEIMAGFVVVKTSRGILKL